MNYHRNLTFMVRHEVKRAIKAAVKNEDRDTNSRVLYELNEYLRVPLEISRNLGIDLQGIWDELYEEANGDKKDRIIQGQEQ